MECGHVYNVVIRASGFGENNTQILPGSNELLLRVSDNFKFGCSANLTSAINCRSDFYGGHITCATTNNFIESRMKIFLFSK